MLVDAVIARLKSQGLARVEGAMELQGLIAKGALPAAGVSAFVVPLGLRGGAVRTAAQPFVQDMEETIGVFLALREVKPEGDRARDQLTTLIDQVIAALAGWQPASAPDVFRLTRGTMVSFAQGIVLYQLDFATQSQVRIVS